MNLQLHTRVKLLPLSVDLDDSTSVYRQHRFGVIRFQSKVIDIFVYWRREIFQI
jgi:hypothetical protein